MCGGKYVFSLSLLMQWGKIQFYGWPNSSITRISMAFVQCSWWEEPEMLVVLPVLSFLVELKLLCCRNAAFFKQNKTTKKSKKQIKIFFLI